MKRLAKAVRTLRTSTGRPVGDYIGEIEAEETVRSAGTRTAPRYYDDGSVTIVVGMSLDEVDRKIAAFVTSRSSTEGVESPADGDWQNLSWGLTPSEVMRLRPDARKVGKRLAELKASVAGHPAKVVFLFVKGRLGGVRVLFDGSETNPAADLAIYQELRRLLTQKYGRPREANDEAWLTDNRSWRDMPRSGALAHGVLEYRTTWRKGGTHVQLTVSGGEKTELGLPRARANLKYVSVEMARAQKASVGKKRLNDL